MRYGVDIFSKTPFGIDNLPIGVGRWHQDQGLRPVMAIGHFAIDLRALHAKGLLSMLPDGVFGSPFVNDYIGLDKAVHSEVRNTIQSLIRDEDEALLACLIPLAELEMQLPIQIGDYTDFYSSMEHAINVGSLYRDPEKALAPNWKSLPVGYHGRSSSIVVSGHDVVRPCGQYLDENGTPIYGPSQKLDYELEMGFVVGQGNAIGRPISVRNAEDHIYGLLLFNDWSARDIQKWEYVPLGPFLGKNFISTVSPWIVSLEALEDFRVSAPAQEPSVLPYLLDPNRRNIDIQLEVWLEDKNGVQTKLSAFHSRSIYWTMSQQLAHHTVNGCNVRPGDLLASGTISGPEENQKGCLLERSYNGTKEITLSNGDTRTFLEDGDTIILKAFAENEHKYIGFGEVRGQIIPANY